MLLLLAFLDVAYVSIYGSQEHVAKMARRSMATGAQQSSQSSQSHSETQETVKK